MDNSMVADDEQQAILVEEVGTPHHSLGQVLSTARERKNLSAEQLADRLKLGVGVIRQIEQGTQENMPPRSFIQGYVRSYAKEVGLAWEVVSPLCDQQYPRLAPEKPMVKDASYSIPRKYRRSSLAKHRKGKKRGLIVTMFIVFILFGLWVLSSMEKGGSPFNSVRTTLSGAPTHSVSVVLLAPELHNKIKPVKRK